MTTTGPEPQLRAERSTPGRHTPPPTKASTSTATTRATSCAMRASTRAASSRPARPISIWPPTRRSTSRSDRTATSTTWRSDLGQLIKYVYGAPPSGSRRLPQRPRLDVGDERLGARREGQVERRAAEPETAGRSPSTALPTRRASARMPLRTFATGSRAARTSRATSASTTRPGRTASVVFQVFLDGTKAYDSGTMTGASATKSISLDLTGKSELRLVVTNGGDNDRLTTMPTGPTPDRLHRQAAAAAAWVPHRHLVPRRRFRTVRHHTRSSPPTSAGTGSSTS